MPSCTGWQRMGLIAALLVAASACGGTSAEGTGPPSTGYPGSVTEAEARGGMSTEGTGVASSSTGGVTGAEADAQVFFPKHRADTPLVGYPGRLVEDGAGCIRFDISEDDPIAGGENPTVLWPRPWSAERARDGRVPILGKKGRVLARVGDEVWLPDGFILPKENPLEEVQSVDEPTKRELLRRCPGLYYFTASSIRPASVARGETTWGQYTVDQE